MITTSNSAFNFNITKASKTWYHMNQILSWDTADSHIMAWFYLAFVQAKLLYGSEIWVLSQRTFKWLEPLHNQCACTIAHHPIHWHVDSTLEHRSPTDEVLDFWGLSDISTYIAWCKTRLLNQYAKPESPLYSLCNNSTPIGSAAIDKCGGHKTKMA
jgi:hypothetical protein